MSYQKLENEMQKSLKIMKKRLDKTEKQCYNVRENKEEFFALTVTPVALPVDMFLPLLAFFCAGLGAVRRLCLCTVFFSLGGVGLLA